MQIKDKRDAVSTFRRDWMNVGKRYTDGKHEYFDGIFERLEWQSIPCTLSAMGGLAIKAAIKELNIPKVSRVAESKELAPYGLVAVEGHFSNGRALIYFVDTGTNLAVLAADFYSNGLTN